MKRVALPLAALLITTACLEPAPDVPPEERSEAAPLPVVGSTAPDVDESPDIEDPPPVEEPAGETPAEPAPEPEPEPEPGPVGDFAGELPVVPTQAGVAYVAHYETADLQIFRYDSGTPSELESVDIGGLSIDAKVDSVNDRLFVAHDVNRTVEIFELARPTSSTATIPAPQLAATLSFEDMPRHLLVDPYSETLYVLVADTDTEGLLTHETLLAFDVSDPSAPLQKAAFADTLLPVTTSLDIDPIRKLLFVVALTSDVLHIYDISGEEAVELTGTPIDLVALYPEDNNLAFQARNLTVDAFNARVYAGRAQSALSELIAFSYGDGIPQGGARYVDGYGYGDVALLADGFDTSLPPQERPNLLGAYTPAPDPYTGDVYFVADAWNGNMSTAMAVPMRADGLAPATACADYEGFGCFLRSHYQGAPSSYVQTDGAACFDATHRVLVTTSYDVYNPQDPGMVHLFASDDELDLQAVLPEGGGNLRAGGLPIGVGCH
jgi:hypothetical protein